MPAIGLLSLLGLWTALGAGMVLLSMVFSNPVTIGPVGVTIWFVILLSSLASGLTLLFYGFKTYFHVHPTRTQRLRYSWRQGFLLAGWLTGILALASLGQLGWRDVILLGIAAIIVELYVRFRWP